MAYWAALAYTNAHVAIRKRKGTARLARETADHAFSDCPEVDTPATRFVRFTGRGPLRATDPAAIDDDRLRETSATDRHTGRARAGALVAQAMAVGERAGRNADARADAANAGVSTAVHTIRTTAAAGLAGRARLTSLPATAACRAIRATKDLAGAAYASLVRRATLRSQTRPAWGGSCVGADATVEAYAARSRWAALAEVRGPGASRPARRATEPPTQTGDLTDTLQPGDTAIRGGQAWAVGCKGTRHAAVGAEALASDAVRSGWATAYARTAVLAGGAAGAEVRSALR